MSNKGKKTKGVIIAYNEERFYKKGEISDE